MFNRIRFRYTGSIITSFIMVVIYIWNRHSYLWLCLYIVLKVRRVGRMNIVVKKVPKCLRGIVKLIFGIKD